MAVCVYREGIVRGVEHATVVDGGSFRSASEPRDHHHETTVPPPQYTTAAPHHITFTKQSPGTIFRNGPPNKISGPNYAVQKVRWQHRANAFETPRASQRASGRMPESLLEHPRHCMPQPQGLGRVKEPKRCVRLARCVPMVPDWGTSAEGFAVEIRT